MNSGVQPAPPSMLPRVFFIVGGLHVIGAIAVLIWIRPRHPSGLDSVPDSAVWFAPADFVGKSTEASVRADIRRLAAPSPTGAGDSLRAPDTASALERYRVAPRAFEEIDRSLAELIEKLWRAPATHAPPARAGVLHIVIEPWSTGISCRVDEPTGNAEFDHALVLLAEDMTARHLPLPENWPGGAYEALAEVGPR